MEWQNGQSTLAQISHKFFAVGEFLREYFTFVIVFDN